MSANGTALIQLQGVKKVFYTDEVETHALADVHLEIKQGEYVSIAGPSGCGKTTLLSLLGLLDTPTEGTYLLEDRPVANLSAAERARIRNRRIGFIFQAFNLIGDLTVYENVELPLTYRGMGGAERKQRSQAALERVGMSHRSKHYPAQLSGGQQQRVAVARAVVGDPAILLADEPTGNLDSTNGEAVMELLRELHRGGATVCMVTHDPRYAQHADRTVQLFDGRVVEEQGSGVREGRHRLERSNPRPLVPEPCSTTSATACGSFERTRPSRSWRSWPWRSAPAPTRRFSSPSTRSVSARFPSSSPMSSCRLGSTSTARGGWAGGIRAGRFSPSRCGKRSARSSRPSRRCSPGATADGICPPKERRFLRLGSTSAEVSSTPLGCPLASVAC